MKHTVCALCPVPIPFGVQLWLVRRGGRVLQLCKSCYRELTEIEGEGSSV